MRGICRENLSQRLDLVRSEADDEWTDVFGSERLTGALLDRLTHHAHILEMNGESYRLKHSRQSAASQVSDDPVDS